MKHVTVTCAWPLMDCPDHDGYTYSTYESKSVHGWTDPTTFIKSVNLDFESFAALSDLSYHVLSLQSLMWSQYCHIIVTPMSHHVIRTVTGCSLPYSCSLWTLLGLLCFALFFMPKPIFWLLALTTFQQSCLSHLITEQKQVMHIW